jgi:hypothetical protein
MEMVFDLLMEAVGEFDPHCDETVSLREGVVYFGCFQIRETPCKSDGAQVSFYNAVRTDGSGEVIELLTPSLSPCGIVASVIKHHLTDRLREWVASKAEPDPQVPAQ